MRPNIRSAGESILVSNKLVAVSGGITIIYKNVYRINMPLVPWWLGEWVAADHSCTEPLYAEQ